MQYLLDFIHEHTVDDQLYLVTGSRSGQLELSWDRRADPEHWRARIRLSEGPWELIPRRSLLAVLAGKGADLVKITRELQVMAATQIAFADTVLRDARRVLGPDVVQGVINENRAFVDDLRAAVELLIPGSMSPARTSLVAISGGGAQTEPRAGHLSPVSAAGSE
jgi:hypothetical protein